MFPDDVRAECTVVRGVVGTGRRGGSCLFRTGSFGCDCAAVVESQRARMGYWREVGAGSCEWSAFCGVGVAAFSRNNPSRSSVIVGGAARRNRVVGNWFLGFAQ